MASVAAAFLAAGCMDGREARRPSAPAGGKAPTSRPSRSNLRKRLARTSGDLASSLIGKLSGSGPVAVLPLVDADGGITRLGVLMAEGVEAKLAAAGVRLVDRRDLNVLLAERNLRLAELSEGKVLSEAGRLANAHVLVVGRLLRANGDILASARALKAGTGELVASGGPVSLSAGEMRGLLWYVRRPTATQARGDLPPLAVQYQFVTPTNGGESRLDDGSTVRHGQRFKIRVQPNSDCHLYVLLYDSSDRASVLFPHSKIAMSNEVRGGVSYEIPEAAKWYWFDNRPGTETFYLVASYAPMAGLGEILAKMERAGEQQARLAQGARERIEKVITRGASPDTSQRRRIKGLVIRHRGVGGVVDLGPAAGGAADRHRIDSVVQGYATVVKKLTLQHR